MITEKLILIVEDEPLLTLESKDRLQKVGYRTVEACSVAEALERFSAEISLAIFDINLSGPMDGVSLAAVFQDRYTAIPFIFLTSYHDDTTISRAKELHPAAFLTKPLKDKELEITVSIVLQNQQNNTKAVQADTARHQVTGNYCFDFEQNKLTYSGEEIKLTKKEIQLVRLLFDHFGTYVDVTMIDRSIWEDSSVLDSTRRSLVKNLRDKLPEEMIHNARGLGYRIG